MIKLFEEYNEYYHEITQKEFNNGEEINFTRKEIQYLTKLYKNIKTSDYASKLLDNFLILRKDNLVINIYKLPDEWYIVGVIPNIFPHKPIYYKCDQMEGLVKLLDGL